MIPLSYIHKPRAQITSMFEGQPSKTRPFSSKARVIWVLGTCSFLHLYIYIYIIYIYIVGVFLGSSSGFFGRGCKTGRRRCIRAQLCEFGG